MTTTLPATLFWYGPYIYYSLDWSTPNLGSCSNNGPINSQNFLTGKISSSAQIPALHHTLSWPAALDKAQSIPSVPFPNPSFLSVTSSGMMHHKKNAFVLPNRLLFSFSFPFSLFFFFFFLFKYSSSPLCHHFSAHFPSKQVWRWWWWWEYIIIKKKKGRQQRSAEEQETYLLINIGVEDFPANHPRLAQ